MLSILWTLALAQIFTAGGVVAGSGPGTVDEIGYISIMWSDINWGGFVYTIVAATTMSLQLQ
jgi:hypothetical protein